LIEDERTR